MSGQRSSIDVSGVRFLMIAAGYPPFRSAGLERGCERLSTALARRGHSVHVLTLAAPGLPDYRVEEGGVHVHRVIKPLAIGPLWGLSYMAQVRRWMKRLAGEWDIVLSHKLALQSAVIPGVARALGRKSANLLVNAGQFSDIAYIRRHKGGARLLRWALEADAFFALSAVSRAELLAAGIPSGRIHPFRYMVDTGRFSPGSSHAGHFLSIGRFHPQKNLPLLVTAFERVHAEQPAARLLIIGRGESAGELQQRVSASPARSAIQIEEWTDDPAAAYRDALAVVSSSNAEGLSNVSVEAAACGAPTILTDVSGVREVLDPHDNAGAPQEGGFVRGRGGLIVRPGDAEGLAAGMLAMMMTPSLRDELAIKARANALERFSEEQCVELFLDGIRTMMSPPRPPLRVALLADAQNRHSWRWARWLAAAGVEVHLLSDRAPRPDFDYTGIHLHRPEWTLARNLYVYKIKGGPLANSRYKHLAWRSTIRRINPDILHAHEAMVYGPMLAHFPEYPRVLTPWGPDVEKLAEPGERADLIRSGLAAADVITTNGPGLEDHWSTLARLPRDKFELWSWGIDLSRFDREGGPADEALGVRHPDLGSRALYLSPRLPTPYYNLAAIVEGWNLALDARPAMRENSCLMILRAGVNDEVWAAAQEAIARCRHPESLLIENQYLAEADMAALYRRALATIMLPRTDLLSMSLLEALACGTLPIVEALPVHRASLTSVGEPGELRPAALMLKDCSPPVIAEAFLQARVMNPEQLEATSHHNRGAVARLHDWSTCAPKILAIYQRLVASRPRR